MSICYKLSETSDRKKIRRQDQYFSTRLNYANKKIREIWINMVNTKYNSTEDMIDKL